jgi:hypothetical protein
VTQLVSARLPAELSETCLLFMLPAVELAGIFIDESDAKMTKQ